MGNWQISKDVNSLKDLIHKHLKAIKIEWGTNDLFIRIVQNLQDKICMTNFDQLEISKKTLNGLMQAGYETMTEIQNASLSLTLNGKDLLGAAKTGSGKTLCFLIPALEVLYKNNWTRLDGLGVLIISPTRELALQIYKVLVKIGKLHSFSAGLLIGGKDFKTESSMVNAMNILVCTPGRLLQHMDQTPEFTCDQLQLLVLDEADKCLDIGFESTLNAIIENLPKERQTLLFSATQTKKVKDLARLSLVDPEYVAVNEANQACTPIKLTQKYAVVNLPDKLNVLFSFIKSHTKSKIIVFISSCKQVRFIYETFCKLQPGIPLMCLFGKQKQGKRSAIFEQFSRKQGACLFATDIAARGLDFPAVDWVFQLDCPEDVDTYIHRVGRTARYESSGNALLILLPSEEKGMLDEFEKRKIPIEKIKINPQKTVNIVQNLLGFCSQSPEIKYLAQKCFISYMRSIYLHGNKFVFDVHALPAEEFAESLGLPGAPKISFVKKSKSKNQPRSVEQDVESDDASDIKENTKGPIITKVDKMFRKKNLTVLSDHYAKLKDKENEEPEESDEEFLTMKRRDHDIDNDHTEKKAPAEALPHRQILKLREKELKQRGLGKKFFFDENGDPLLAYRLESLDEFTKTQDIADRQKEYLNEESYKMSQADGLDKTLQKQKLKEKKMEKKRKEKISRQEDNNPRPVVLGDSAMDPEDNYHSDDSSNALFDETAVQSTSIKRKVQSDSKDEIIKKMKHGVQNADRKTLEKMALALLQK